MPTRSRLPDRLNDSSKDSTYRRGRRSASESTSLAKELRPPGVVKLTDVSPPLYRVREGQYRVPYTINDDKLIVLVIRIGHRVDVYRKLEFRCL